MKKPRRHPLSAVGGTIKLVSAALLLGLATAGAATAATLYKWVDERGVTHLTDERPPEGVDYETVDVSGASRGGGTNEAPSAAVRKRRCRDFKGALTQLRGADNLPDDASGWESAKQRAKSKIDQWCRDG